VHFLLTTFITIIIFTHHPLIIEFFFFICCVVAGCRLIDLIEFDSHNDVACHIIANHRLHPHVDQF